MGKKGTWFSAIKRLFTSNCKPVNESEKKRGKQKKGPGGRLKHGFFRKPSSIEEILGEIDQHNLFIPTAQSQPQSQSQPQLQPQPQPQPEPEPQSQSQPQPQPQPPPQPEPQSQPEPSSSSSGRPVSPPAQRLTSPPRVVRHRPEPTLHQQHLSATRIQAVYRGYTARRKVRSVTGLARLQRVLKSRNVKRQTVSAMKQMQLLVRVQTQIQSRRIQMLALKPQPNNHHHLASHKQDDVSWDDSLITKEEREARLKRKEDALVKRERVMAYANSHQLRKDTAHQTSVMGGYPWWCNWLERQLPTLKFATTPSRPTTPTPRHKQLDSPIKYYKARKGYPNKDDDSSMSCPPFSVPNYMSPTASARAKAKETPTTPRSESSTRRSSFPFTPNKHRHRSPASIGDLSMDSAISMPASLGRKPFNRFA